MSQSICRYRQGVVQTIIVITGFDTDKIRISSVSYYIRSIRNKTQQHLSFVCSVNMHSSVGIVSLKKNKQFMTGVSAVYFLVIKVRQKHPRSKGTMRNMKPRRTTLQNMYMTTILHTWKWGYKVLLVTDFAAHIKTMSVYNNGQILQTVKGERKPVYGNSTTIISTSWVVLRYVHTGKSMVWNIQTSMWFWPASLWSTYSWAEQFKPGTPETSRCLSRGSPDGPQLRKKHKPEHEQSELPFTLGKSISYYTVRNTKGTPHVRRFGMWIAKR